jgi:hypothetical protein
LSALMNLDLTDDAGNEFHVTLTMRTVLRWEQTYPGRSLAQFSTGQVDVQSLYELAFLGFKKSTGYGDSLEVFSDLYDVTPVADSAVVPTPTVPAV